MSINRIAVAELILYLYENEGHIHQISDATGMSWSAVREYLTVFHRRKLVRICDWVKFGNCRRPTAIWTWNYEILPDVPMPKPKSRAEVAKEYRNRKIMKALIAVTTSKK